MRGLWQATAAHYLSGNGFQRVVVHQDSAEAPADVEVYEPWHSERVSRDLHVADPD